MRILRKAATHSQTLNPTSPLTAICWYFAFAKVGSGGVKIQWLLSGSEFEDFNFCSRDQADAHRYFWNDGSTSTAVIDDRALRRVTDSGLDRSSSMLAISQAGLSRVVAVCSTSMSRASA